MESGPRGHHPVSDLFSGMTVSGQSHPTPRAPPRRVLEDPSGRRLRRLRWVGRATALLILVWLAIVILGGLGVGPARRLPLGHMLSPTAGPPRVHHAPKPVAPAQSDLVPALPAPAPPRAAVNGSPRSAAPGKSETAPGRSTTTTSPGRSGSAPGHTVTSPGRGRSGSAPGHTRTTPPGKSGSAPGKKKKHTTTTAPATTTTTVPGSGGLGHGKKP
jgi:hypothetical protein